MAIIPQQTLFVWSDLNELGDLERLRLVLDYIPDEEFMQKLNMRGETDEMITLLEQCGIVYLQVLSLSIHQLKV
jgi:hypothetical protein